MPLASAGIQCAYPRRDGQAELTWMAGYSSGLVSLLNGNHPYKQGSLISDAQESFGSTFNYMLMDSCLCSE